MTRDIPQALLAHLQQEVTTTAFLWRLKRTDNTVLGFTNHDKDISYDSVTYQAKSGFLPSDTAIKSDLSVNNQEIEGLLDSSVISEVDLLNGVYDYSEVTLMLINYVTPSDGVVVLLKGWTGRITLQGKRFVCEVRSLTGKLNTSVTEQYSASCRARLGDARCQVDLTNFTHTGTVTSITNLTEFTSNALTQDHNYFTDGVLRWTSGGNNGLEVEVKFFTNRTVRLVRRMPYQINVADAFSIVAGCDKIFDTCKNRFNNVINFRGEIYVPGDDYAIAPTVTR